MAMRTFLHVDNDWENTSNWVGNAVPVTGDYVYIPAGSQSITANMNQTDVYLAGLEVDELYSGTIGASGSPLRITSAKTIQRSRSGGFFYTDENSGGNTEHTKVIIVDAPGNFGAFTLTANGSADDEIDSFNLYAGGASISPTTLSYGFVKPNTDNFTSRQKLTVSSSLGTEWHITSGEVDFIASPGSPSLFVISGGRVSGTLQSAYGYKQSGGIVTITGAVPAANDTINGDIMIAGGTLDITGYQGTTFGNNLTAGADFIACKGASIIRRADQSLVAQDLLDIHTGVERTK